jgi:hypothetical protein
MTDVAPDPILRVCDKCGLEDTEAHHVQYVAFTHPVTGEATDLSVTKHVQCCAEDGCEICAVDVQFAAQMPHIGTQSAGPSSAFTEYMRNKSPEHLQALFEAVSIETPEYSYPDTSATTEASQEVTNG